MEYDLGNEPEYQPTEEDRMRVSGHYETELEQMMDPTLPMERRHTPKKRMKEIASFPQMLPPYQIERVAKLLNDENLVNAAVLDRVYAVLSYIETLSQRELWFYEHVFKEFLGTEYVDQEEELRSAFLDLNDQFSTRFKEVLDLDRVMAEAGIKMPLSDSDDELTWDYFDSHYDDLQTVLKALRNIRSVMYHGAQIRPYIKKSKREELFELGKKYFIELNMRKENGDGSK